MLSHWIFVVAVVVLGRNKIRLSWSVYPINSNLGFLPLIFSFRFFPCTIHFLSPIFRLLTIFRSVKLAIRSVKRLPLGTIVCKLSGCSSATGIVGA